MRKLIWLLIILLFPLSAYAKVETTANGPDGKIKPDIIVSDTEFYKTSTIGIPDNIMKGRAMVDAHRKKKQASYTNGVVYTHDDRVESNVDRLLKLRIKLQQIGFVDEGDLIQQSIQADIKAGVKESERWQ